MWDPIGLMVANGPIHGPRMKGDNSKGGLSEALPTSTPPSSTHMEVFVPLRELEINLQMPLISLIKDDYKRNSGEKLMKKNRPVWISFFE